MGRQDLDQGELKTCLMYSRLTFTLPPEDYLQKLCLLFTMILHSYMGVLRLIVHLFVVAHMIITATFGLQAAKMSLESSEMEALFDPLS